MTEITLKEVCRVLPAIVNSVPETGVCLLLAPISIHIADACFRLAVLRPLDQTLCGIGLGPVNDALAGALGGLVPGVFDMCNSPGAGAGAESFAVQSTPDISPENRAMVAKVASAIIQAAGTPASATAADNTTATPATTSDGGPTSSSAPSAPPNTPAVAAPIARGLPANLPSIPDLPVTAPVAVPGLPVGVPPIPNLPLGVPALPATSGLPVPGAIGGLLGKTPVGNLVRRGVAAPSAPDQAPAPPVQPPAAPSEAPTPPNKPSGAPAPPARPSGAPAPPAKPSGAPAPPSEPSGAPAPPVAPPSRRWFARQAPAPPSGAPAPPAAAPAPPAAAPAPPTAPVAVPGVPISVPGVAIPGVAIPGVPIALPVGLPTPSAPPARRRSPRGHSARDYEDDGSEGDDGCDLD